MRPRILRTIEAESRSREPDLPARKPAGQKRTFRAQDASTLPSVPAMRQKPHDPPHNPDRIVRCRWHRSVPAFHRNDGRTQTRPPAPQSRSHSGMPAVPHKTSQPKGAKKNRIFGQPGFYEGWRRSWVNPSASRQTGCTSVIREPPCVNPQRGTEPHRPLPQNPPPHRQGGASPRSSTSRCSCLSHACA